jgi:putative peptidoglycan lipid II flippase
VLTIVLGLLFAFPLRPFIVSFFQIIPGLRVPNLPGIELALGAVGLTASAGIAGWIEFLLLRRSLASRVGSAELPMSFLSRIWGSALVSAVVALLFERFAFDGGAVALRLARYNFEPLIVIAAFGICYLIFASLLKVEETKALTRRFLR